VALQKWQYAAEQVGIGGEKTADILKDVSEKIGDAFATGGGEAAEVIDRLNLSVEDLVRLSPDQQILKISEQLTGMPKAEQIQVLESLASDASLLLPLLDNNAQKLRELAAAAEQRGDILTEEELQRLAAFDAAFERMKTAISGVFKQIAVNLAPAFQKLAEQIDRAIGSQPELIEKISAKLAALVGRVTELATEWANSTGSMEQSFRPLVSTLEGTRQLFLVLVSAVQVVGATIAEVVARANYDWKNLSVGVAEALNAIGLGSDEAVLKARLLRDVAAESVRELDEQADQYVEKMKSAASAAASAFSDARTSASQAAAGFSDVSEAAGAAVDDAGQKTKDAAAAAAEAIAGIAREANKALKGALDTLKVDLNSVSTEVIDVERGAVVAFATASAAISQTGATAKEQSSTIAAAFESAFDRVETAAGRKELLGSFRASMEAGTVSAEDFNRTLQNTVFGMDEIATREQAQQTVTNLTKALDDGLIAPQEYGEALQQLTRIAGGLADEGDDAGGSLASVKGQVRGVSLATREVTDETGKWWKQVVIVGEKSEEAGEKAKAAAEESASAAQGVAAGLASFFNGWSQKMASLSKSAAAAFTSAMGGAKQVTDEIGARISTINDQLADLRFKSFSQIGRWMQDTARKGLEIEKSFLLQKRAADGLTAAIQGGARSASILRMAARGVGNSFGMLDRQQLSGLQSALQSVRREAEQLNDSLTDTISNLNSEIAGLMGDMEGVERIRQQQIMADLQEQLRKAQEMGDKDSIAKAEEAIKLAEKAGEIRLANIKAEEDERKRAQAAQAADEARLRNEQEAAERERTALDESRALEAIPEPFDPAQAARQTAATQRALTQIQPQAVRTVAIQFQSPQGAPLGGVQAIDDQTIDQVIAALERAGLVVARGA
jgi:hypothetical protein